MLSAMRRFLLACLLAASSAWAGPSVVDDTGHQVELAAPAQRVVSLAPHVTELLYAAGAGDRLVGVGSYSDYPPAAKALPQIGSHASVDVERLVALQPDLVVAWQSGNGGRLIERLRALGLTVYVSEPQRLDDIATALEQFGVLAGSSAVAEPAAAAFRARYRQLAGRYAGRRPVRVFYQIWHQPLMTINGEQIISQAIRLCGGINVFAELPTLAPQVGLEAVLATDPEAIVASGIGTAEPEWLDGWRRWPELTAVKRDNLFFVPSDLIQRHTPRFLDGAELLCQHLETARRRAPPR